MIINEIYKIAWYFEDSDFKIVCPLSLNGFDTKGVKN